MDRLVRDREAESLAHLGPQRLELSHEAVLPGEWKISVDDELPGKELGAVGQTRWLRPKSTGDSDPR
jgi:hypothetical protein